MNNRFLDYYMDIAERTALLSRAVRLKVGAVLVKDGRIISQSWNGTPAGQDNNCENREWMPKDYPYADYEIVYPYVEYSDEDGAYINRYKLVTKPEVIHAEANLIMKLASSSESGKGATIFQTHAPCINCAKLIYGADISTVFYKHEYKDSTGINFLKQLGITVNRCQPEETQ